MVAICNKFVKQMLWHFSFVGLALLFSVVVGSVGNAASFDCNKATTETEITICADPYLSALDELIASAYFEAKRSRNNKQSLIESQRAWILERDEILQNFSKNDEEFRSAQDQLHEILASRLSELLNELTGFDYDTVLNIFNQIKPISLKFEKNKRVLVFSASDSRSSHNIIFFDSNHKLVKAIHGEIYGRMSACEQTFDLGAYKNGSSDLSYVYSCGNGGRHGWWEYAFSVNESCIKLNSYNRHQGQLGEQTGQGYEYSESSNHCLEQNDYNFEATVPSFVGWSSDNPKSMVKSSPFSLLSFLTKYWQHPPVEALRSKTSQNLECNTDPLALTRIKLITLFEHFTLDYKNLSKGVLYHPREHAYILTDPWAWDYQYSSLIDLYKKNSKIYDLFLPVVKLLDQNNEIAPVVDFLINLKENPELKIAKFQTNSMNDDVYMCQGPYFAA
ncbi:lysozyme inhibitor LprI family protein, partial [Planktomarina temperata]|nr:lysozyme inhibitor LprI family protein [Planktomarina temperata]